MNAFVTGPLPPSVEITTWKGKYEATEGITTTSTWAELAETYRQDGASVRAKDKLRAPVFCVVRPECTSADCDQAGQDGNPEVLRRHRCDRAVVRVTAFAAEHDHHVGDPAVPIDHAIETLRRLGLAGMPYETPSSTPEGPRWRVVVPMTEPWTSELPGAWKTAYRAVQALLAAELGCTLDEKTLNPSRIFYPPTRPTKDTPSRRVEWIEGEALDVAGTLATIPAPAPPPAPEPTVPRGSQGGNVIDRAIALLRTCEPAIQKSNGSTTATLTAAKLVRGLELDDGTTLDLLRTHYNPRCVPPWSEKELRRRVSEGHRMDAIPIGSLLREPHPLLVRLIEEARTGDDATLFDVSCKLWRQAYAGKMDPGDVARELEGVCAGSPDEGSARRTVAKALEVVDRREPEPPEWMDDAEELLGSCVRVDEDWQVSTYLRSRGLDPIDVAVRDLALALPKSCESLPPWARFRGRPWTETGHRLVLPVFDASGTVRSVRAWRVSDGDTPKRLPPSGHKAGGLVLLDSMGREAFRAGGWPSFSSSPPRFAIVEGELDFLTWAVRTPLNQSPAHAVVGIPGAGSWAPEIAAAIPDGAAIAVRTHHDLAGNDYAATIAASLQTRCQLLRGGVACTPA